jgi:hypothetical protein
MILMDENIPEDQCRHLEGQFHTRAFGQMFRGSRWIVPLRKVAWEVA